MTDRAAAHGCLPEPADVVGILLAAGRGTRFGGDKLLSPLADGTPVAVASCRTLVSVLPAVVAVVRPDATALAAALRGCGAYVAGCADSDEGMGRSLACGASAAADARGWVVALADMPWIAPATVASVLAALRRGAPIVVPQVADRRGHPVGFGGRFLPALVALRGDEGARSVVRAHADLVEVIRTDDEGAVRDVDVPGDLRVQD